MTDSEKIIFNVLTNSTPPSGRAALFALISTRAWSPIPPPKSTWKNTDPAIIFHFEDDAPVASGAIHKVMGVFKCYGGSGDVEEARDVYRALFDRLHQTSEDTDDGRLDRAWKVSSPGRLPPEPGSGWVAYVAKCRLNFEEGSES